MLGRRRRSEEQFAAVQLAVSGLRLAVGSSGLAAASGRFGRSRLGMKSACVRQCGKLGFGHEMA